MTRISMLGGGVLAPRLLPACALALGAGLVAFAMRPAPRVAVNVPAGPPPIGYARAEPDALPAPVAVEAAAPEPNIWLRAFGRCTRPSADQRAAIDRRVLAWIDRAVGGAPLRDDEIGEDGAPTLYYGCLDRAGLVVDVQTDRLFPDGDRHGYAWVFRITRRAIRVLGASVGDAQSDYMEYAAEESIDTIALADLDRDGVLDPIMQRVSHEGGATESDLGVLVARAGRVTEVGHFHGGWIDVQGWKRGVVLAIGSNMDEEVTYRLVTARKRWRAVKGIGARE